MEKLRKPDVEIGEIYAIWYDPKGVDGENATEVELEFEDYYSVAEYQDVRGLIEDYDEDYPFLKTETTVQATSIYDAVAKWRNQLGKRGGNESFVEGLPE